ncbi:DDE_3 domain-containing protein [Trichonephila clavata]|uniref:DDE_3 domain-containing protein n=1 Tax=Trichonephila clavata TaxID=2740835 RepID=A0A8X6IBT1_TRICU|nr:DDE_3 domain-containing protein [Trichonephila clavata]
MRHPTRPELLQRCSRSSLLNLDISVGSPKSPDMNFIEYIWGSLQCVVQNRSPTPLTPTDLWTALQDAWCQLPPTLLQTLIESMPLRVAADLCARGGPI